MRVATAEAPVLTDILASETDAVSAFEDANGDTMIVEAYFANEPLQSRVEELAAKTGIKLRMLRIEPLPETDWVAKALEGRPPIRAGRFYICAPEDRPRAPGGSYPLVIAATQGFGTGSHPSTRGCLLAIDALAKRRRIRRALDLGCGSGVLAFAMVQAWRRRVLGADIDRESVRCARENARANGLAPLTHFVEGSIAHAALRAASPFDLVVANILAGPLAHLARPLAQALAPGGMLVLSGLLAEQETYVRAAYRARGLALRRRIVLDGWAALVLGR